MDKHCVKVAVVSTLKMPEGRSKPVDSFLRYHLSVGFDHIFLFFDDPADRSIGGSIYLLGPF